MRKITLQTNEFKPPEELKEGVYYYPKNLRSEHMVLLWTFKWFLINCTLMVGALYLWTNTKSTFAITLTAVIAFLTMNIGDVMVGNAMLSAAKYLLQQNKFTNTSALASSENNKKSQALNTSKSSKLSGKAGKKKPLLPQKPKGPNTVQKLVGAVSIGGGEKNIYTSATGKYAMWSIEPFNLAVMSPGATEEMIVRYTNLLSGVTDLEVIVTDAARSFEDNIRFLKKRIKEEENPAVRSLLERDLAVIQNAGSSVSYSRQYLFMLKLSSRSTELQDTETINRVGKTIQDCGFNSELLTREDIHKVFANFFDIATPPDISYLDDYQSLMEGETDNE